MLYLQALHCRLQPFLLFFIDGASFIDAEDNRWELLVATEQHNGRETVVSTVIPCATKWLSVQTKVGSSAYRFATKRTDTGLLGSYLH